MCGISGIYTTEITDTHHKILSAILESQTHRGPDYQAKKLIHGSNTTALLGHNRLSIIDLSASSHQPMHDATERYWIVYNGEIYNYIELRTELKEAGFIFNTQGDTEVILNAFACWGIDALNKLQGPFAFVLFDTVTNELWLCRDRFGVRPLYYSIQNNTLYFASSTTQLAKKLNLKPNLAYISRGLHYLIYEDDSDISPYENIKAVPASSYIACRIDSHQHLLTHLNRYYDLSLNANILINTLPIHDTEHMLHLISKQFNQATKIRLRSDVPLGISLSSGLDSSTVAAFVKQNHDSTVGFSFGHPAIKKSEGPLVAKSAHYMNLAIEYVWPTADEMVEGLFQTIEAQEAPFPNISIVAQYLLYKKVKSCGIKVLLGGQGADESFMGYRKFLLFWIKDLLKQKKYFSTAKNVIQMFPLFINEISSFKTYWRHRNRYLRRAGLQTTALQLPESSLTHFHSSTSLFHRQFQDITQLSLPTLLRYEDRNAMAHSVESRLPFLDHSLVELGLALPTAMKIRGGFGKWPIRQIAENKIPNQIRLARYKRGFDIPLADLLKAGFGNAIRAALNAQKSLVNDFIKQSVNINSVFSDQSLIQRQNAMAEAITLLWLSKAYT
jgi:asparagine synthase (glutamine-hydrolysing)